MAWRDLFRWGRKSASTLELFRELYGDLWRSKAGRSVTLDTAIRVSTVFGCCRVVGNGIAQVPLKLMREMTDARGRVRRETARSHPLYRLLAYKPNAWMTSFEFRQLMSWHVELAGRFVAFKVAPAGRLIELIPLQPDRVTITQRDDYSLKVELAGRSGQVREVPAGDVWIVRGPSWTGVDALNTLQVAREAIGLSIAIEESQASLHENGVRSSGVYSFEGKLADGQYEQLKKWIEREHVGAARSGAPMILDRGAKWLQTQMTGLDAQTLESRREQIADVCRFFGVMPIMLGHADKVATYASAEQMFLAHMVHCLSPRWTMYEQSMDANLLTDTEREQGYYFDFVEEGMIRGSVKDTVAALLSLINGGVITPNEGRGKLDLNPDDDPASDELRIPVNVSQDPNAKPGTNKPEEGD